MTAWVLTTPGQLALVASGADDPGAFTEDFCRWRDVPEIGELARHSRAPAIAAALMALRRPAAGAVVALPVSGREARAAQVAHLAAF